MFSPSREMHGSVDRYMLAETTNYRWVEMSTFSPNSKWGQQASGLTNLQNITQLIAQNVCLYGFSSISRQFMRYCLVPRSQYGTSCTSSVPWNPISISGQNAQHKKSTRMRNRPSWNHTFGLSCQVGWVLSVIHTKAFSHVHLNFPLETRYF